MTALTLVGLATSGCGQSSEPARPADPQFGGNSAPASQGAAAQPPIDSMMVKARQPLASQLKTAEVGKLPIATTVRVPGRVAFDDRRVARIGVNVTGRVSELRANVGDVVKPGDLLAELNSTELSTARLAFVKAAAQRDLQSRAVERARLLLKSDVIGSAELQRRQSELSVAQAEEHSAAEQLRVMGMDENEIAKLRQRQKVETVSSVRSTIPGAVVERRVDRGQVVGPTDTLFTVADLSHVWAIALVPESDARSVSVGQTARLDVPALDLEEPLEGKLIWVSDVVDPQTRMINVRMDIDNQHRLLKPGMLATMIIESRATPTLVVPTSAVVRELNVDHVFVQTAPDTYRLTPVKLGDEQGVSRVLVSGVTEGQTIVVDGAFHLNNERRSADLEAP